MLEAIATLLIVFGFFCLVAICAIWLLTNLEEKRVELTITDHDPYAEGLDAAARISGMAFEADRMMHEVARRSSEGEEDTQ